MVPPLTTAAAVPYPDSTSTHYSLQNEGPVLDSPTESLKEIFTPVEEKKDIETPSDGLLHAYIEKGGEQVLITWTHEEQRKAVRKADFLFLPIFTVGDTL